MFLKASIKLRIILLAVVGMVGMCVITGANRYLDLGISKQISISYKSGEILKMVMQNNFVEEQFRNAPSQELIDQHEKNQKTIVSSIEEINKLTESQSIIDLSSEIQKINKSHGDNFSTLSQNIFEMNRTKKDMLDNIQSVTRIMNKAIADVDKEEAMLSIDGEFLDGAKATLRVEFKDFMRYLDARLILIQNLFLSGNSEEYLVHKKESDAKIALKQNNIMEVVKSISSEDTGDLRNIWMEVDKNIPSILQLEDRLYTLWDTNLQLLSELQKTSASIQSAVNNIAETARVDMANQSHKGAVLGLVVSAGGIIVLLFFGMIMIKAIIGPLNNTVSMLKDIAEGEGDLTKRLDVVSGDEIGEMAKWFNLFIEKIQYIIKDVSENANDLNSSSQSLSEVADRMAKGARQTSTKAASVSTAGEKMHSSMNSVAAAMEEASISISMVASSSEQISITIDEVAKNSENASAITGNAVTLARSASDQVSKLGVAAKEIGQVVESITDISDQVNLLALNATIEAARAGEAGKGFAVVANEIKELARQTSEATAQIKDKVESIQNSTEMTVSEIQNISSIVTDINDTVSAITSSVEEQSVTTREITGNISQASTGIREINENVANSNILAGKIAEDISDVTITAKTMSDSSTEVNVSAGDLLALAGKLNAMVGRFKVG